MRGYNATMAWWQEFRERFEVARRFAFLNHAAVAPLSPPAADALREFADLAARQAYVASNFYTRMEAAREQAHRLIGAESPACVAFVKNTTEGLCQVAGGLDWQAGDNIVTTAIEFPANVYPWMDLQRRGVELRMVEPVDDDGVIRVPTEDVLAACDDRTALIAISAVQYATGQASNLATIGHFARERGILFCVDAIQQLGALPLGVADCCIDFLSADGHKWLLGPEGAGIFYCRRDLIERLRPITVGWMNMTNAWDYGNYDLTFRDDAKRFECGSLNISGIWALGGSLAMFNEIGMDRVWQRIEQLTDQAADGLTDLGWTVVSPRGPGEKSGIISAAPPEGFVDDDFATRLWRDHDVIVAARNGRLRLSPHFYNHEDDITRLLDALKP